MNIGPFSVANVPYWGKMWIVGETRCGVDRNSLYDLHNNSANLNLF